MSIHKIILELNDKKSVLLAYKKEIKAKRGLYFDHVFMTYYHFYKFQERFISFISLMYNRVPCLKFYSSYGRVYWRRRR